jgi:hypothetical protein
MPYLAATELTSILPWGATIGDTTYPLNLGEVASICDEVSAELDGAVSAAGYTVPIGTAAPLALSQMKRWTKFGAGAIVMETLLPNVGGVGGKSSPIADRWQTAYDNAIKAIEDGKFALPGVAKDSGETGRALPRSYTTSHPSDDVFVSGYQSGASVFIPIDWMP